MLSGVAVYQLIYACLFGCPLIGIAVLVRGFFYYTKSNYSCNLVILCNRLHYYAINRYTIGYNIQAVFFCCASSSIMAKMRSFSSCGSSKRSFLEKLVSCIHKAPAICHSFISLVFAYSLMSMLAFIFFTSLVFLDFTIIYVIIIIIAVIHKFVKCNLKMFLMFCIDIEIKKNYYNYNNS